MKAGVYMKIGFKCNNNCLHCGAFEKVNHANEQCHTTFNECVDFLNYVGISNYRILVITGGEPTYYDFLGKLLLYVTKRYPNLNVIVQTNGRLLDRFLPDFRKLYNTKNSKVQFVIPMHSSNEDTFNEIVNSKSGNPFSETISNIANFTREFGDRFRWRSATILSHRNIATLKSTIDFILTLKAEQIGVSYPVLPQLHKDNVDDILNISLDYDTLVPYMSLLEQYIVAHPNITFSFSDIPHCMFSNHTSLKELLPNMRNISLLEKNRFDTGFIIPKNGYSDIQGADNPTVYYDRCINCEYYTKCTGIGISSKKLHINDSLQPIGD